MTFSDASIVILTAALVGVTTYYAGLTRRMMTASEETVRTMKEQLKAFSRPYVSIRLVHGPSAIYYLEIENTGRSTARNLKLTIDRDYEILSAPPQSMAQTHIFSNGVSAFAPGNRVTFGLGTGPELFGRERDEERRPPRFKLTSTYDFGDEKVVEENWVDLDQYKGLVQYYGPIHSSLEKLTKEIKEIRRDLRRLGSPPSEQ